MGLQRQRYNGCWRIRRGGVGIDIISLIRPIVIGRVSRKVKMDSAGIGCGRGPLNVPGMAARGAWERSDCGVLDVLAVQDRLAGGRDLRIASEWSKGARPVAVAVDSG